MKNALTRVSSHQNTYKIPPLPNITSPLCSQLGSSLSSCIKNPIFSPHIGHVGTKTPCIHEGAPPMRARFCLLFDIPQSWAAQRAGVGASTTSHSFIGSSNAYSTCVLDDTSRHTMRIVLAKDYLAYVAQSVL